MRIEKGIPIPSKKKMQKKSLLHEIPFADMEVSDSIELDGENYSAFLIDNGQLTSAPARFASWIRSFLANNFPYREWSFRRDAESIKIRIWRIK